MSLCAVKCMVFNETALAIMEVLRDELGHVPDHTISLDNEDLSDLHVDCRGNDDPVVCKDGWSLN